MKNLIYLIAILFLTSCAKDETFPLPVQTQNERFIKLELIGLKQDIEKQVVFTCGPIYLDTIIKGNFNYYVEVSQPVMNCRIRIRSLQPINDNIYLSGGYKVGLSSSCDYTSAEFQHLFSY